MTTQEPRTFSETEHLAILADRVATETASLSETVGTLTTAKTELETKLDVAISEKAAAEKLAADTKAEFEAFKTGLEAEKAAAEKKDARLEEIKTKASHLPADFVTDEARVARIVAMDDDQFAGYVADLAAANTAPATAPVVGGKETAMTGKPVDAPQVDAAASHAAAAMSFLMPGLVTEGGNK